MNDTLDITERTTSNQPQGFMGNLQEITIMNR